MALRSRPATTEVDASTIDVLVVDDDAAFRESLMERLQLEGWTTAGAADGAEALQLARDRAPRIVLLDLQMPVMNGWQFLERRRADRALTKVPVLVLSGLGACAAGRHDVEGVLEKPIDEARLTDLVRAHLTPPRPTILLVEDDDDTRVSLSEFLDDAGYDVVQAANGREAEDRVLAGPRPDCILLDLWMPVMDGWRFTTRLQQLGCPPIPILVITAAEPHWGYPVPTARVVRKPIRAEVILGRLRQVVAPRGREQGPARRGLPRAGSTSRR
jgi:CheY-like chemotaxis protein